MTFTLIGDDAIDGNMAPGPGLRGSFCGSFGIIRGRRGKTVGLVKTRRLAAMQKQQRAKAGMKPPLKGGVGPHIPRVRRSSPESIARMLGK